MDGEFGFQSIVAHPEWEPAERPYWNMSVEPRLGSEELRKLQLARLQRMLAYVQEKSEYHRARFKKAGLHPGDVHSLDDLRYVPLFAKDDQRKSQEESLSRLGHPFGMHLCVPQEELRLLAATSGTTGTPTYYLFTEEDLHHYNEERARALWRMGLRPGDKWLHGFALSMFSGGVPLLLGAKAFGCCVVPVGAEAGSEAILRQAKLIRPRALCTTPSLAKHLIERAPEILGVSVASLGIEVLVLGGEPGAGLPEVRRHLEESYGARIYDIQGPTASCDAPEYQGMHRFLEDFEIREILDPQTKKPLELKDGAVGEGAVTSLLSRAAPWVRFTPGDLHQVQVSPCPCGKTGIRYKIVGRLDEMLKVKGVAVFPAAIADVVASFRPKVTGEMRILLQGPPPLVEPPLRLRIERGGDLSQDALQALVEEIAQEMHARLKVRPQIEWVAPGSLLRSAKKTSLLLRLDRAAS